MNIYKGIEDYAEKQRTSKRDLIQETFNKRKLLIMDFLGFRGKWEEFLTIYDPITQSLLDDYSFQDAILKILSEARDEEEAMFKVKTLLVYCHDKMEQEQIWNTLPFWKKVWYRVQTWF